MYEAAIHAAAFNANLILNLVGNDGSATMADIKRICTEKGYCDEDSIKIAIRQLVSADLIERDGQTYRRTA